VLAISLAAFAVGTRFAPDELSNANNVQPSNSPTRQPGVVVTPDTGEPTPEPSRAPLLIETSYEAWFTQGEMLLAANESGVLATIPTVDGTSIDPADEAVAVGTLAMEHLLSDPAGLETTIPEGTRLNGISVEDGVATVDLTGEFTSGGGSLSMQVRVAQVVWTLTQFPVVEGVSFAIEGEPVDTIGGEGIDVSQPQTREDWMDFAPPVVVESPLRGAEVSSPVTVSGTANTFEATVQMRIVDVSGKVVGDETFTMATCGTGCRGDYEGSIEYTVTEQQDGFVEVYSRSAENGEPMFMIRIPVTLLP
jgi:hypothetical protein